MAFSGEMNFVGDKADEVDESCEDGDPRLKSERDEVSRSIYNSILSTRTGKEQPAHDEWNSYFQTWPGM